MFAAELKQLQIAICPSIVANCDQKCGDDAFCFSVFQPFQISSMDEAGAWDDEEEVVL